MALLSEVVLRTAAEAADVPRRAPETNIVVSSGKRTLVLRLVACLRLAEELIPD